MSFEYVDHTADVAVRLRSGSAAELFRDATEAMLSTLLDREQTPQLGSKTAVPVSLAAEDDEALLVDYLNELIFLFDTRRFLPADLEVAALSLKPPARLEGTLRGETYDPLKHTAKTEIKAATFHGLRIRETDAGLEAQVVFDL